MRLTELSAVELAKAIRNGETTSKEVTAAFINRIEQKNKGLNAFVSTEGKCQRIM